MSDDSALRNRLHSEPNDDTQDEEPHYMNFRPSLMRRSSESAAMSSSSHKKKPMPGPKPSVVAATIVKLNIQSSTVQQQHPPVGSRSKSGAPVSPPPVAAKTTVKKPSTVPPLVQSKPPKVSVTAKKDVPPKMNPSKKAVEPSAEQCDTSLYCDAIDVQRYRLPPEEADVCGANLQSNDGIYEEAIPATNFASVDDDRNIYQEAMPVVQPKLYLDIRPPVATAARNGLQGHTSSLLPSDLNENCLYEEAACFRADRQPGSDIRENGDVEPEPLYAEAAEVSPHRVPQRDKKALQNTYEEAATVLKAHDDDNSDSEDEPLNFKLMILKKLVNELLCFILHKSMLSYRDASGTW